MELRVRLKELLQERGITQKDFAEQTGLKPSVISELVNNQRSSINKNYIIKIAETLNIDDVSQIIELKK